MQNIMKCNSSMDLLIVADLHRSHREVWRRRWGWTPAFRWRTNLCGRHSSGGQVSSVGGTADAAGRQTRPCQPYGQTEDPRIPRWAYTSLAITPRYSAKSYNNLRVVDIVIPERCRKAFVGDFHLHCYIECRLKQRRQKITMFNSKFEKEIALCIPKYFLRPFKKTVYFFPPQKIWFLDVQSYLCFRS